ncbi:vitamin K epoxide reductase family protein [Mucilaginibacter sp. CSA2-8R]|uniref:vitamin K epoxide reductase family protein n=1 Tax=Mucilaginibacter sp. CSA2-8R TaxID=3141542 RepID=UPI00315CC904
MKLNPLESARKEQNCFDIACEVIKLSRLRVSKTSLLSSFQKHPYNGTLLSLTDIFNSFGIKSKSVLIKSEKLSLLPNPFIAEIRGDAQLNYFCVVKSIDNDKLEYYEPINRRWRVTDLVTFVQQWTGVCLLMDHKNYIPEKSYISNAVHETLVLIIRYLSIFIIPAYLIVSFLQLVANWQQKSIISALFLLTFLAGSILTSLLLSDEVQGDDSLLKKICNPSGKVNCQTVVKSSAGKVFGFSWSIIGFIYFFGGMISILLLGINDQPLLKSLLLLSCLTFPFIFYSIYVQLFRIKMWCTMCLGIVALLIVQACCALQFHDSIFTWENVWNPLRELLLIYIAVAAMVHLLLTRFRLSRDEQNSSVNLNRLKYNAHVFNTLLQQQPKIIPDEMLGVTVGKKDAKIKLVKVCNPYCSPCIQSHAVVERLITENPNVQVQIIYNIPNTPDDNSANLIKFFMSVGRTSDAIVVRETLSDWYSGATRSYVEFIENRILPASLDQYGVDLDKMVNWCQSMNVGEQSPIFFVNGAKLPDVYTIEDMLYIL